MAGPISFPDLPVEAALPALLAALASGPNAVLVAPPGAGKTTRVPLALLDQPWAGGSIIVLAPRRLAARAAAGRMAASLGEAVGGLVGYRVRLETRVGPRTRVEVLTEGVFARRILDDPELNGVSAVVFDEHHERSVDSDLALALALDAQAGLRPDLRLLAMSATLDGARVAQILGGAPVIVSDGRMFPVEDRYLGRRADRPVEAHAADAVRRAVTADTGDILVFLPGAGEIARTARRLEDAGLPPTVDVRPLHGGLDLAAQDAAIAASPAGRRKVVLATSIAETSLTIAGVRVVIDSGLTRRPRFEPAVGLSRLVTVRTSRASAEQRRGRAGRLGPGVCYRLWDAAETQALPAFDTPEILDADLSGLALALAAWGVDDPLRLAWLDPPPAAAWTLARRDLAAVGALDGGGRLTDHGRAIERFGLPPRLAHMVLAAAGEGCAGLASAVAAVLSERGLGGDGPDLAVRLERFSHETGPRAVSMRALADRWARGAGARLAFGPAQAAGAVLALAYPDRLARARGRRGGFVLANGRGAEIAPEEPLAGEEFLVVADMQGAAAGARILLAAAISREDVERRFADAIETVEEAAYDAASRAVRGRRVRRLGRLVLSEAPLERPEPAEVAAALAAAVRAGGLGELDPPAGVRALQARAAFLRGLGETVCDLSDDALIARTDDWLPQALEGARSLDAVRPDALTRAVRGLLSWDEGRLLDTLAPPTFTTPAGSALAIDYAAEGGPALDVRVQELFGLDRHPTLAGGRAPLTLRLLSPASRPVQVTRDLPGFWRGSYSAVRAEMKARYPKHPWPDDPLAAAPTTRAKPRAP